MNGSRRTCGFTLVEMLLVVAIIVLLISMLLPTLGKARTLTTDGRCKAEKSQTVRVLTEYAISHQGRYPDLQANAAGAQTESQLYWVDPYWREELVKFGMQREFWYSPSNSYWNRDDFFYYSTGNPNTSSDFVMGNFYFAGSPARSSSFLNAMHGLPKAGKLPVFPLRMGGQAQYPLLFTDLNRTYPHPFWLTPGDELRHGGNHLDYRGTWPRMSHEGRVDGSVRDVAGPEITFRGSLGSTGYHW